jgi:predicted nucleic acid-binding protein
VILFCDSSAFIKLSIAEPGTDQMQLASREAQIIAVCRITWAEAMAGIARRQREDPDDAEPLDRAREQLIQSWEEFLIVEVSQKLVESAGRYADAFALRAYDSVQLAAAQILRDSTNQSLTFACFGRRLSQAAALLQMDVLG